MQSLSWADYGVLGLTVLGLGSFILWQTKLHLQERKDWRELSGKQFESLLKISNETVKILSEVKTMMRERGS